MIAQSTRIGRISAAGTDQGNAYGQGFVERAKRTKSVIGNMHKRPLAQPRQWVKRGFGIVSVLKVLRRYWQAMRHGLAALGSAFWVQMALRHPQPGAAIERDCAFRQVTGDAIG